MIEADFDPWFGGKNEIKYLRDIKKAKGEHIVPLIVLSVDYSNNLVKMHGGFSPIILAEWGKEQRVAISGMGESIYDGAVRVLAYALLCACGGDQNLAARYLKRHVELNPDVAEEIKNYAAARKKENQEKEQKEQVVKELNRQQRNKPKMEGRS